MSTITRHNVSKINTDPILQQVESIVSLLQKAVKIVCLYPASNPTCSKAISLFTNELDTFLQVNERLLLYLSAEGFTFEGELVEPSFGESHRLSKTCYDSGLSELEFSNGFSSESADEVFGIFRTVITKDRGELELGEALWGKKIPGFDFEIIEDQSYLEFDSNLQREFFGHQNGVSETGYISDSDTGKTLFDSTFESSVAGQDTDDLTRMAPQLTTQFESVVSTLSDDTTTAEKSKAIQVDSTIGLREMMMSVYDLDSQESHETAMALAKDSMLNSDTELICLIDDLFEHNKRITEFSDAVLTCVKAHSYFIENGSLKRATEMLRTLQRRRSELDDSNSKWKTAIDEALSSISSRERFGAVCDILNADDRISADEFSEYLATFDWTAYSTLTEALSELESQKHRMALCDFLASAKVEHVDLVASGLYDKRWYVVRNTAIILSSFDCDKAHRHLTKAMQHTESRVRIEVVRGCQHHAQSFKSSILLLAITDREPSIRNLAIEVAMAQSGEEAFPLFSALFGKLLSGQLSQSSAEQIILSYSKTGQQLAVSKLALVAGHWRFFGNSPYQQFRRVAILALQNNSSDEATKALTFLSKSWSSEIKKLSQAALKARELEQKVPIQ